MKTFQEGTVEKDRRGRPSLLALQASPRPRGFTAHLMEILLEGARQVEGVEIEEIFLPHQRFEFCTGCFSCKSVPYHCPLKDSMGEQGEGWLHKKLERANAILLTLPTYFWSANALTHTFFERCYPFLWSQQLNGLPFAFVASAYNSGMHREAARWVEKWAFILSLHLIGGIGVHFVHLNEVRVQLRDLGKRSAQAALEDFHKGRRAIVPEERYIQALQESWDLPGLYLDNITQGTGRKEDLLTTLGFQEGWFRYREAFRFFKEADELFRRMVDCLESGQREEAMRILSRAHRVWKDGTFMEFISRNRLK
ncbi:MAG: NAD(P)H-dependent oxidoreductase [Pseudomonadota bacterium]